MVGESTNVAVAVPRAGRDRHRVAFLHLGLGVAENGVPVERRVSQMNFHPFTMEMTRHIGSFSIQPSKIPGMVVSVDQWHNRDPQIWHHKRSLCRSFFVAGDGEAIATCYRLHLGCKPIAYCLQPCVSREGAGLIKTCLNPSHMSRIKVEAGNKCSSIVLNCIHRTIGKVGQRILHTGNLESGQTIFDP